MESPAEPARGWRTVSGRLWSHYRWYILLSGVLFAVGIVVGVLLVDRVSLTALFGGRQLDAAVPEPTVGLLVINNAIVVLLLVASTLTFGLVTVAILVYNGVIIGYVATLIARSEGIATVVLGLVPHGIVEIPAFLLASAVAFRFSHQALGALLGSAVDGPTGGDLREALAVIGLALVLVPIAAVIEAQLTTRLLETVV